MTVKYAAEALGFKVSTIRALIAKPNLPRVNYGQAVSIPTEAFVGNKVSKKRGK